MNGPTCCETDSSSYHSISTSCHHARNIVSEPDPFMVGSPISAECYGTTAPSGVLARKLRRYDVFGPTLWSGRRAAVPEDGAERGVEKEQAVAQVAHALLGLGHGFQVAVGRGRPDRLL